MMSLLKIEISGLNPLISMFKGYRMSNFISKNMKTYSYMMSLSFFKKNLINVVILMFMRLFLMIF
ncbi:hypothetical protein CN679_22365 [Bacillus pseudomycoides]|nr:hypothetical protein KOW_04919 [Bacillus cereus VDM006]PEI87451.1 hypothetical protein CN679_22365 [Bacillus pseudomycoides]